MSDINQALPVLACLILGVFAILLFAYLVEYISNRFWLLRNAKNRVIDDVSKSYIDRDKQINTVNKFKN